MSKINQIQQAILSLGAGAYQKLMDAYLFKRYRYENIMPLGSHIGTDKTTKGIPDSFVMCENKKFILISYGTVGSNSFKKVKADIQECLKPKKTKISVEEIEQIVCCHTSTNFTPGQIKELCSLFSNVLLIGIADISYDLLYRYQSLALDHLGIEIDSHQIFDIDDFIKEAAKNAYSTTLDMPLLCRETELNEVTQALDSESVILIFGASGIGKTRLAIEAARQYAQNNSAIIKVIKSNNESIYEDLKSTFGEEDRFVVIVDDANQLGQLNLLLNMVFDSKMNGRIKLILTVRDYAKVKVQQVIRDVCRPFEYQLSKLSNNNIDDILSKNLGIENKTLRKQIQLIAKGNARLAVMAGACVLQGNVTQIRNAFDIFNDYYSSIIEDMDHKELLVASIVALFESFKLEESAIPLQLACKQGVDVGTFVECCYSLHKKEVVSVYENRAVRFENQNLRDYLIYYVFFKSKMLAPSDVIISAFPQYRSRIIFAFTTIVQLFNTEDNYLYIESEIRKTWRSMQNCSADTVEKYIESFFEIIPNEALLYVKKQIDQLPVVQNNLAHFNFRETRHQHIIHSKIISLLAAFKNTDQFKDAIQLAIYYFEKNNENPMDFYFLFGDDWGFTHTSYRNDFASENILVDEVFANFEEKKTLSSAQCLYFVVSHCLKFDFSSTEAESSKTISYIRFRIPACESILRLREKCIHATSELLKIPEYAEYSRSVLSTSFMCSDEGQNHEILREDISALAKDIAPLLTANNFEHCHLLEHIEEACERSNIPYPSSFEKCDNNQVYAVYQAMRADYHRKFKDYDLGEAERKEVLKKISTQVSVECFNRLWIELQKMTAQGKEIPWEVSTGIEIVFDQLQTDKEKFIACVDGYMQQDAPGRTSGKSIVDALVNLCGIAEAERMVSKYQFRLRPQWLAGIYDHIQADEVTEEFKHKLLSLREMNPEDRYPISFETVINMNKKLPGFIVEYIEMLNEEKEKNILLRLCQFFLAG